METFFDKIENLNYVVQRNWLGLPDNPGDDVDLFVSDKDYLELLKLAERCPVKIDVRSPSDGYYPLHISHLLLEERRHWKNFFIPNKGAYFLALYYHDNVHKEHQKYQEELKRALLDWIKPTEPTDTGVGYFI